MTKEQLINIYKLLQSSHTVKFAFKMGESFNLSYDDLLKLMWCKLREYDKLTFDHWILKKDYKKNEWFIFDSRHSDGTELIPWNTSLVFQVISIYLNDRGLLPNM